MRNAEIGIIGGTGVYYEGMLKCVEKLNVKTPYGKPSSKITLGSYEGRNVAFVFRHGEKHTIPPHNVNSRANIYALKKLGVQRIIGISAVGSLNENMKPGDIVTPDQFIDMTKQRKLTFYDGPKVAHISVADPFCPELRTVAGKIIKSLNMRFHNKGAYVCVEGPRFSTRAESNLWRLMKSDIIGMTLVPEVNLAREMEICYLSISSVTDYDCWKDSKAVSAVDVAKVMKSNVKKIQKIMEVFVSRIPKERKCPCKSALKDAGI
jgi:5'-methylthioadenosine phosphorylase